MGQLVFPTHKAARGRGARANARPAARAAACAALIGLIGATAAQAGEVYTGIGLPGIGIGYAQPLNSSFTLRGDFFTLGERDRNKTESSIPY